MTKYEAHKWHTVTRDPASSDVIIIYGHAHLDASESCESVCRAKAINRFKFLASHLRDYCSGVYYMHDYHFGQFVLMFRVSTNCADTIYSDLYRQGLLCFSHSDNMIMIMIS